MSIVDRCCKECGATSGIEQHHIIFRSELRALQHCNLNYTYLCQDHHRGEHGVHDKNEPLNLKLKLEFQNTLEFLFAKEYLTKEEINDVLKISNYYLDILLEPLKKYDNTKYHRDDVIKRCMAGRIIKEEDIKNIEGVLN